MSCHFMKGKIYSKTAQQLWKECFLLHRFAGSRKIFLRFSLQSNTLNCAVYKKANNLMLIGQSSTASLANSSFSFVPTCFLACIHSSLPHQLPVLRPGAACVLWVPVEQGSFTGRLDFRSPSFSSILP